MRSDAEVERFKGVEAYLKKQLQTMEAVISSKNSELDALQKELESNKTTYEEKVVYLQMQMNTAKGRDEGRDKEKEKEVAAQKAIVDKLSAQITALQRITEEKELSYKSNKELIQALQTRLMELEPELAQSKDKIAQFERNSSAQVLVPLRCCLIIPNYKMSMFFICYQGGNEGGAQRIGGVAALRPEDRAGRVGGRQEALPRPRGVQRSAAVLLN